MDRTTKYGKILRTLPNDPGVYFFKDEAGKIIYVGKAKNLKLRVKSYFQPFVKLGPKTQALVGKISKIEHQIVESELEALLLEAQYIGKYLPKYNIRKKDDKSYLYIKITKEQASRVYAARKQDIEKNRKEIHFGPFPSSSNVRQVLSILRRIFPFRSCRILPQKPCLYFNLGLCLGPCLETSSKDKYQKTIKNLICLLKNERKKLIRDLEKEMLSFADTKDYEEAAKTRDKLSKLKQLLEPFRNPLEYIESPNLLSDRRKEETDALRKALQPYYPNMTKNLWRIEAYDISNFQGQKATGSMVVFAKGNRQLSNFRKFRIRMEDKPNDVAMMREVLERRLRHKEWRIPDLILVDGGKGQVGGAVELLRELSLNVPVVGLAKRLEILVIPKFPITYVELSLPKNSPALNLLKRIRDEAHRFANAYHRKLREIM
ncbi:MAG: GIY-YIG nuclease family protein [bacterium]|nr:GIY-YIG nuclease family protein [bacterium]